MAVADPKTDTTVISAATDEVQEKSDRRICYGIYRHSKCFHGKRHPLRFLFDMQYLEQKYTIQNEFKLRNVLR